MRMLLLLACASLGITTAAVVAAKDPPPSTDNDKVVCKRQVDADTGSHFATSKKVCLRKSEWRQMEDAAENTLRRVRETGGACPKCLAPGNSPGGSD